LIYKVKQLRLVYTPNKLKLFLQLQLLLQPQPHVLLFPLNKIKARRSNIVVLFAKSKSFALAKTPIIIKNKSS